MSATKLDGLKVDEVSGVDAPANQIPGWMVIKSEDGAAAAAEAQLATLYGALGQAMALEDAPEEIRKAAESIAVYVEKELGAEDEDEEPAPSLIDKMRSAFRRRATDASVEDEVDKARKPKAEEDDSEEDDDEDDDKGGVSKSDDEKTAPAPAGLTEDDVLKALTVGVEQVLEPVADDLEVLKEAVSRVLDRVEALEDVATGSDQAYGQESSPVSKSGGTLRDAIMRAASGERVTIN